MVAKGSSWTHKTPTLRPADRPSGGEARGGARVAPFRTRLRSAVGRAGCVRADCPRGQRRLVVGCRLAVDASKCVSVQREIRAVVGHRRLACCRKRSFAKHRTIVALEHARELKARRRERDRPHDVEMRGFVGLTL